MRSCSQKCVSMESFSIIVYFYEIEMWLILLTHTTVLNCGPFWFRPPINNLCAPPPWHFIGPLYKHVTRQQRSQEQIKQSHLSEPLLVILAEERRGQLALLFPSSVDKLAFTSAIILLGDLTHPRWHLALFQMSVKVFLMGGKGVSKSRVKVGRWIGYSGAGEDCRQDEPSNKLPSVNGAKRKGTETLWQWWLLLLVPC